MRTGALVAGSAAIALVLSACGSGGDDSPTTNSSAKGETGFNAATKGVVNPSDKKGGTLKLVSHDDPDSFDPIRAYYAWVWNFSKGYYARTLLTNEAKPGEDGLKLVPDLAAEMPKIEDGGKKYTFTLKDGVKFEDGSPITSKDIKYGIERNFATDVLSGGPPYLTEVLDQGQSYPGPYKDTDPNKLGLKSVQTPDDKTIVFTLKEPLSDFQYLLAMPGASPLPQAKDTGDKYGDKPFSSGPYKFQSYDAGKKAVLVRNENWDPKTDTVRKALPDTVELTIGTAPEEIDNQLLSGDVDVDVAQTGVQQGAQPKVLLNADKKKNADTPNTGFIRYFSINTKVAPFDNIHCRKAVQYATDKTTMQTARGGADAGGDIGINMLPPNIAGHDDYDPYNTKSGKPQIDKAKEELKLCGKPDGFETVLATRNAGKEPKTAEALQAALTNVGIKVRLDPTDASLYFRSTIGSPTNVHAKGYGLMMAGWGADFPTGYGFLSVLVDGRNIPESGNNNYAELNNSEVNSLIDKAKAETDPAKAADIWKQINHIVMDEAVMVPFVFDKALNYRNPRVTNVYVTEYYGMYDFGSLGVS
ncbi:ABC transporter substrate-binding protein [Dactylosporangium fulvum]|uniref:ABC transporter substrate-binding protein n=1 Tax=Dactylosporangium fulvum TaxID=53359 RepID=A0ABY5W5R8_9ACTN|nr:ABC transporter substrate-binding protein [Dactylosporangium fulvum]UWP84710.1 ABC transporter substrate-binding protein [Dactylosporangium fulvum]